MPDSLYEMRVLSREIKKWEEQELRRLWKEAFREEEAYLDFYHSFNLKNNRIWTLWDGERLISMLHANPYRILVKGTLYDSYFIVGVATEERYRRKGCMGRLMKAALRTFQKEGIEFVYLLPAKEEYYLPFGFRTVGTQHAWMRPIEKGEVVVWEAGEEEQMLPGFLGLPGAERNRLTGTLSLPGGEPFWEADETAGKKGLTDSGKVPDTEAVTVSSGGLPAAAGGLPAASETMLPAERKELPEEQKAWSEMARFANAWLSGRAVSFTYRDAVYYRRRAEECRAMEGGLYLLRQDNRLAGVAAMGQEDGNWLLYDVVGDALLEELAGNSGWKPVEHPQKIMVKWLGEGDRLGEFLPFVMEELT